MAANKIARVGEFLYKYRAVIAIPFFILLVIFSRPTNPQILLFFLILIGLFIRIWAGGYIGLQARQKTLSGQYVIANGPYRFLKHPLYIGNFFLVLGVIILFNPPTWFAALLIVLFIFEYSIITMSELNYLKNLPLKKTKFKLANTKGEIFTILIIIVIYIIYNWGQVLKFEIWLSKLPYKF